MNTREVSAKDLQVGMILVGKDSQKRRFEIINVIPSMGGRNHPYLTMKVVVTGETVEHDTSFDKFSATYTVEHNVA